MIDKEIRSFFRKHLTQKTYAVCLMLISALLFALMQIFVKLSSGHIGTLQQVFSRNLISALVAFIFICREHVPLVGAIKYQPILFARSFFGFVGIILFFYAARNAPQADVAILNRLSPVFVTIFAAIFLKEKITRVQIPVILLCLGGAYIAMRPSFESNFLPLLMALLAAVTSGIAYTLVAYCRGRVSPLTVIFHFSLFSTVFGAIMMIPSFVMPNLGDVMMLLLIGLCGSFGQIMLTYAYQMAPASQVSIYQYAGVVFTAILGYFLLGETLAESALLGGSIIIGASLWAFLYNRKQASSENNHQKDGLI